MTTDDVNLTDTERETLVRQVLVMIENNDNVARSAAYEVVDYVVKPLIADRERAARAAALAPIQTRAELLELRAEDARRDKLHGISLALLREARHLRTALAAAGVEQEGDHP